MRHFSLVLILQFFTISTLAQRLPLIDSGEALKQANVLADSGKYDLAIQNLLRVPSRDTNYVWVQARVAELYNNNKQYDEAIAIVDRLLKRPDRFRSALLSSKAVAYEGKKEYDEAIRFVQSALKEYPYNTQLRYHLATSYHNKLDYPSAIKAYYDVLEISPFTGDVHLNLAVIARATGQRTHAMMSYGLYLAISNTDNARLVQLENLCSNQSQNEGTSKEKGAANAFEKLDQIIRSKIAMDKNFKTEVPVDAAIVRQFEMMAKQLSTVSPNPDDPWTKFYLPVYEAMRDQKLMEPFLYHILTSSTIEAVKKWNSRNGKARDHFFTAMNSAMARDRGTVRAPESLGLGATTHAEYTDKNTVEGVGGIANGKENGKWIYFHNNSEKSAEGLYENGTKKGIWNYYTNKGVLSSTENEDNGDVIKWAPDGTKEYSYVLKNDKIDGEIIFYHPCGTISERRMHKDGKRSGKGHLYYATGVVSADFEYFDGKLGGVWVDYDVLGNVKGKAGYKNGERDGLTESFWSNGKPKDHEPYAAGKLHGAAEGYHDNGKLWYKGSYGNDEMVGEWLYYNRYGEQVERRFYTSDGKLDQDNLFYHNGKLHYKLVHSKGINTEITYYDKSGKELWKGGSRDGSFDVKHFYAYGQLLSEGKYKKGQREGKWRQYYINGAVQADYNYVDGNLEGEQTDYYINGKKKVVSEFKAGKHSGYYQEFHISGKVAKEGWYQDGDAQQQWMSYNADGSLSEDMYYLNDKLADSAYQYSVEGKISVKNFYKDGEEEYESAGNAIQQTYRWDNRKTEKYDIKYQGGSKSMVRYNAECGLLNGSFERFYPDGKTYNKFNYVGGVLHGQFKAFDALGTETQTAEYRVGAPAGYWHYRNEINKPDQSILYVNGQIDSVLTSYYESGGVYFTAEYRGGERHGVVRAFAPDGMPMVDKMYEYGQIAAIRIARNGEFGEWMPMKPSMEVVALYPNGTKAYEEKYENGYLNGVKRIWYPDGKVCREFTYTDGDYEGPFANYYSNGKVCNKGQYHFDELEGIVEFFQENGMPVSKSTYKGGLKSGTTTLYSKGVKLKEIIYYNGTPMK